MDVQRRERRRLTSATTVRESEAGGSGLEGVLEGVLGGVVPVLARVPVQCLSWFQVGIDVPVAPKLHLTRCILSVQSCCGAYLCRTHDHSRLRGRPAKLVDHLRVVL